MKCASIRVPFSFPGNNEVPPKAYTKNLKEQSNGELIKEKPVCVFGSDFTEKKQNQRQEL